MAFKETIKSIMPKFAQSVLAFFWFRLCILREWLSNSYFRKNNDNLPLPSPILRFRVHGAIDAQSFLNIGRICAQNIRDALMLVHRDLDSFEHVLDFGCGCARILRWFRTHPESCRFYGVDIDPKAISWCRKTIDFCTFETGEKLPPLPYPDNTFNLIYAVSVFTHLDENYQFAWLGELRRVAKINALVLLTIRGDYISSGLYSEDLALLKKKGFLYKKSSTGRFRLCGLPDFYQDAYHTRRYIYDTWSKFFEIYNYIERGINNCQDIVILKK